MWPVGLLKKRNPNSSHCWYSISNRYAQGNDPFYAMLDAIVNVGLKEDAVAVENMQNLLDNDKIEFEEMSILGDRAGLMLRKVMLDWALEEYGERYSEAAE